MSVNKDQVKKLYDATSQDYGLTNFDLFVQSLNDDVKRKEFFDLANVKYDIGNTLEEFENNLGIKKKILAEQGLATIEPEAPKAGGENLSPQPSVSVEPTVPSPSPLPLVSDPLKSLRGADQTKIAARAKELGLDVTALSSAINDFEADDDFIIGKAKEYGVNKAEYDKSKAAYTWRSILKTTMKRNGVKEDDINFEIDRVTKLQKLDVDPKTNEFIPATYGQSLDRVSKIREIINTNITNEGDRSEAMRAFNIDAYATLYQGMKDQSAVNNWAKIGNGNVFVGAGLDMLRLTNPEKAKSLEQRITNQYASNEDKALYYKELESIGLNAISFEVDRNFNRLTRSDKAPSENTLSALNNWKSLAEKTKRSQPERYGDITGSDIDRMLFDVTEGLETSTGEKAMYNVAAGATEWLERGLSGIWDYATKNEEERIAADMKRDHSKYITEEVLNYGDTGSSLREAEYIPKLVDEDIKKQVDAIMANTSLSRNEKYEQVYPLIKSAYVSGGIEFFSNPNKGNINLTSKNVLHLLSTSAARSVGNMIPTVASGGMAPTMLVAGLDAAAMKYDEKFREGENNPLARSIRSGITVGALAGIMDEAAALNKALKGGSASLLSKPTAISTGKNFVSMMGREQIEELSTEALDGDIVKNWKETMLATAIITPAFSGPIAIIDARRSSDMYRQLWFEAGASPLSAKAGLKRMLDEGAVNSTQYEDAVKRVDRMAQIVRTMPTKDLKGQPLSDGQKAKYADNLMKKYDAQSIPETLPTKVAEQIAQDAKLADEENATILDGQPSIIESSPIEQIDKQEQIKQKNEFITDADFVQEAFTPEEDAADREALPESQFQTEEELSDFLANGQYAMLTGQNPEATPLSKEANRKLNEKAQQWLSSRGLTAIPIFGKYGNSERSFMVPNMTKRQAVEFAKEFQQESVAHSSGLVYQDGSFNPRQEGVDLSQKFNQGGDNFSTINVGGKKVDFSINYDFNTKVEPKKALYDSLRKRIFGDVEQKVASAQKALDQTGVKINMIQDPAEFDKTVAQFGGQKGIEGVFVSDQGQIYINQTKLDQGIADGRVIWHEASHPVVNIIRNTNRQLFDQVVSGLKQSAATNKDVAGALTWAEQNYAQDGQGVVDDEAVVETIAGIADGMIDIQSLPTGVKQSIIDFINTIAKALGLGQIVSDTDISAFKKVAGDVANALREGRDISEIVGAENVREYGVNIGVPTQLKVSSVQAPNIKHKGGQYDLSFVSAEDVIDIESLVKDIASKNQNVWFWTADQLGRGVYFDKVINGEHYLDAGPSFALDPANRERNIIWATGKGEKWVKDKIDNSDYIFIISGSPTKSKLFNRRVAELTINRIKNAVGQEDAYNKFKNEVLAVSKITELNNILNRHDSFESLLASPDRKQMLIKFDEQKAKKGTPLKALLENYDAFVDYNELRDGFYKENGFELNDVMLVLKPTGYGGKSAHSTYENDVLGEVVGVPDKKINAFDIMTDEFKAQYAPDMSRTEQSQAVAPYGAGIKKVQMSKGNRAVAQAMSEVNNQMTEDGQGNYVFYHYSSDDLKKIDPAKFGRNLATGRDERPGVGLSMYYTRPDVRETMVPSDFGYVVRIPKDKVYPFNEDPLELLPIAEREFNKKFPGQAFDLNKQIGFVTKVAADRGYPMTVAKWNVGRRNVLRAQTVESIKPERFMSKEFEEGFMQEKINPKLDFVPNAKKRTQMSKGNRPIVGQINWQRSPEGKGDPSISARNKVVTQAAADLKDGKITNEEYRATVSENSPILPITRFFEPASEAEVERSLDKNQAMKANTPVADGTKVGLRLDIPAYKNNNTWVVSVHEGDTKAGKAISYRNVARITDVRFGVEPKASLNIAAGLGKAPINRIYGKWNNIPGASMTEQAENAKALVQEIVDDPNYVQVGMNPFRHSYFYDRNTDIGRPIVSADEVIQVGGLVYAKNPVYGEWTDESYRVKGMLDAAGAPVQFSKGNRDNEIRQFIRENIGQYSPDEISQAIQDELGISKADADAMVAAESKGQAPLAEEIQTFQEGQGEETPRAMADQFEGLAPEVESQIDDDARTYFAKTNKQTDEEVDKFIEGKRMDDLADYVVSNPNIPARVKIWMAAKVAKNLGNEIEAARAEGNDIRVARLSEKQANIYNTFAREATELGQAVQAFVAFNDDPNAVNFFLNKILRQLKENGVESITDQQRSEIIGLMQAVNNARPGLPKNKAIIQLSHYLGRLAPVKIGDVLQSIWYAHILSGVTTQLKNIYANTTMLALELPIGATWQAMKNRSLMPFVYAMKGLGSGMFKGIVKGADILRAGVTEKGENKFFGTEPLLEYFSWKQTKLGKLGGGAVGKFLDFPLFIGISPTTLKMVGRALAGADAFFSTTAQESMANMLAYNQAVAEGKSGITPNGYRRVQELLGNTKQNIQDAEAIAVSEGFKPKSMEYKRRVIELVTQTRNEQNQVAAEEFGKRVTLTNEPEGFTRGIYQVATAIQQYMPISRVVIPFTRIVSNISEMIINYSPAGAYRAITGIKNPKLSFKFSPTGDNKLSDEARGELFLKSSMAIAAVALLMDNVGDDEDDWFDITGGGPSDFQKKYELMKGGWRPYTITLKNGKKINYSDWPIAGALSGLGTMRDIQQYEKEDVKKNESRLGLAAYGYLTAFYDKSLINGISDFVDLFRLKGKYGPDATSLEKFEKFMAKQAKALSMTNFSQQVFKLIQEYNDDPIKEAKGWETLYRDLPVLNDGMNPIIDVFGDPVTPSTSERLLPFMTVKDEKKDPIIEMLNKKGIFIGIPEQKPFIELTTRTEREMTRDELYRYRKMAGEYTKAILVNRIDDISKAADKYEGEFKQKAWEKMIGNAVSVARKRAYVDLLMNTKTDINKLFENLND